MAVASANRKRECARGVSPFGQDYLNKKKMTTTTTTTTRTRDTTVLYEEVNQFFFL